MNFRIFATLACAFIMSLQNVVLAAPPLPANPHEEAPKETGTITGVLRSPDGGALGEYPVSLDIFHKDQMVLKIPKKTDPDGKYQFKNIFQSPDFHYIVNTEYEGKLYATKPVSLGPKESLLRLDLALGNESLISSEAAGEMEHKHDECPTCKSKKTSINEYQILAVLLSLGVIGYLVFFRKKRT